jgi:16S rRNA (guanine966-N2)-methyltransferase
MHVIKGLFKSYQFKPFKGDNTRPTTNKTKEILFDVLENHIDFEKIHVADVFAGTGNISLEFLSRGALSLSSVDYEIKNYKYLIDIKKELNIDNWVIHKQDAINFISNDMLKYDVVFADPPYNYQLIHPFVNQMMKILELKPSLIFIIEHASRIVLNKTFLWQKKEIGDTSISFYKKP